MEHIAREDALALLKKYNKDPFHIQHAYTVEAVMKWYAKELGYGEDAEYWGIVGLLHDIDFEQYPEEHCLRAPELPKMRSRQRCEAKSKTDEKQTEIFSKIIKKTGLRIPKSSI